ncbi:FIST signal transduction protein [Petrocella sp. FN5]|uniref:FIST signal transduction protein n=1 Tax=Petrocella sp. FN5 TaxID=3032002 RepID=UPI0023D9ABBD|nr:FIST N-terminal domain-containing protein [Petrocella sp. FN5]MDF1618643.1 FIST N-terminal domain-containing protein [Petrocella sp. FN5]
MIKVVVGHSEDVEAADCIMEVLEQCQKALGELTPHAGIVYNAIHMDHQKVLDTIMDTFPKLELIGCTTDGEISSILGCVEDSITLILFYSDTIEIQAGMGEYLSQDAHQTAMNAINQAEVKMSKSPSFCITLAESVTVGGVSVINALKSILGHEFPIFGGLAADQWSMKKTYQFYKREILTDSILVLLFAGNIIFSSGLASGWTPIGHKKRITKVDGNVVYEVDQEPILDFYNRYVGGNYKRVPTEYPLAVFPNEHSEKYYIRSPYTFNEDNRSVTFFGDVPEDVVVQLVSGSIEKMSIASETALKDAIESYNGNKPEAALVFTCSARKAILGLNVDKEYHYLQKNMPESFPICGFYTYGEICPLENGRESYFHNGTIAVLLIGEE